MAAIHAALEPLRAVWEPAAFHRLPVAWEADWPELARWTRSLSLDAVEAYEDEIARVLDAPDAPRALLDWVRQCEALSALGVWPVRAEDAERQLGVKPRKNAQIEQFIDAVIDEVPDAEPLVDWCAGKGHLGRTLALRSGRAVRAVERDAALCVSGAALAGERGVPGLSFACADAMTAAGQAALDGAAGAVALHACGQLTDALIGGVIDREIPWLAFAPCCYWRLGAAELHTPRSRAGHSLDLHLDRALLRLACNEERTGSPSVRSERRRRMAWRLALGLLQQEARGTEDLEPLPEGVRPLLRLPFRRFVEDSAGQLGVPIPPRWDPERAEARGWERARMVRGLGLVRAPFRRPLELWAVLDRALLLAERGYGVRIGSFCLPSQSPRNLLVLARRPLSARTPST